MTAAKHAPATLCGAGRPTVERAFRSCKIVDLKVRPIFHDPACRVRAHVLLCMLACHVEWHMRHMRHMLAPMLFDDDDPQAAQTARASVVAPTTTSPAAKHKAATERTSNGMPVHSFQTLLDDLATVASNRVQPKPGQTLRHDHPTHATATTSSRPPRPACMVHPVPDSRNQKKVHSNQSLTSTSILEVRTSVRTLDRCRSALRSTARGRRVVPVVRRWEPEEEAGVRRGVQDYPTLP